MQTRWTGRFADEVRRSRALMARAALDVEPTAPVEEEPEPEESHDAEDEGA